MEEQVLERQRRIIKEANFAENTWKDVVEGHDHPCPEETWHTEKNKKTKKKNVLRIINVQLETFCFSFPVHVPGQTYRSIGARVVNVYVLIEE